MYSNYQTWLNKPGVTGKYVTDFPDDLVWDHKNAIVSCGEGLLESL
jgi:hypothetical protein